MVSAYSTDPAADIILGFKSDAHWYDVTNISASRIGIGMAEDLKNSGEYYVAVEMGF
ncbi:hypothetical protein [Lactiplantibacillus xiangfangensis]|uniref:hypothetical protein n=1 Tax=Lactiplantibacillus xiangfangensis TaxID=942150 RepID=UPI00384C9240